MEYQEYTDKLIKCMSADAYKEKIDEFSRVGSDYRELVINLLISGCEPNSIIPALGVILEISEKNTLTHTQVFELLPSYQRLLNFLNMTTKRTPCTHTYKAFYLGMGYVRQCTKCGDVKQ